MNKLKKSVMSMISSEAIRNHPSSGLTRSMQFTSVSSGKSKKTWRLFLNAN